MLNNKPFKLFIDIIRIWVLKTILEELKKSCFKWRYAVVKWRICVNILKSHAFKWRNTYVKWKNLSVSWKNQKFRCLSSFFCYISYNINKCIRLIIFETCLYIGGCRCYLNLPISIQLSLSLDSSIS